MTNVNDSKTRQLMNENLAIKHKTHYYVKQEGAFVRLGKNLEKSDKKLKTLDTGKLERIEDGETPEQNPPIDTYVQVPETSPEPFTGSDLVMSDSDVDAALSSIQDINITDSSEDALGVYINGVNQMRFDHPDVKACPVVFAWQDKADLKVDGNRHTIGGWTVFDKVAHKALIDKYRITTTFDDTQRNSFVTYRSLILCVMKRDQYFQKKETLRIKGNIGVIKGFEKRQEMASSTAHMKDPEQVVRALQSQNVSDRHQHAKHEVDDHGHHTVRQNDLLARLDAGESIEALTQEADALMSEQGLVAQGV